jgi:hypothetical protein
MHRPWTDSALPSIKFIIAIACQTRLKVDVFRLGGSQARRACVRGEGRPVGRWVGGNIAYLYLLGLGLVGQLG